MKAPGGDFMPNYEEYDVMRKDGNYRRYAGVVCFLLGLMFVILVSNFTVRNTSTRISRAKARLVIH